MSSKDDKKAERERLVFLSFLQSIGIAGDNASVESRRKPEPDILFKGRNGYVAFELMEICTPEIKRDSSRLKKTGVSKAIWSIPSLGEAFGEKLRLVYDIKHPFELLCYAGKESGSVDSEIIDAMKIEIESSVKINFRRIWYLGENGIFKVYETGGVPDL